MATNKYSGTGMNPFANFAIVGGLEKALEGGGVSGHGPTVAPPNSENVSPLPFVGGLEKALERGHASTAPSAPKVAAPPKPTLRPGQ
jgi:hypothetical protein